MPTLLEDSLGRPKPQVENEAGTDFLAWKGANGHGNVRSDDGEIESVGATTDAEVTGDGSLIAITKRIRTLLSNLDDSITQAEAITPSDATAIDIKAVYVGDPGATGSITVDFKNGGTGILLKGIQAGKWHRMAITKIYATGTDATDIIGAI